MLWRVGRYALEGGEIWCCKAIGMG
jgi:hypothetical protein